MLLKSRCRQDLRQFVCYHLVGSALHQLDDAIFDELDRRMVLAAPDPLLLGEGPAPEVMNRETKHDNLEGVFLLSTVLTPAVEHVATIVEVTQVGLGGAVEVTQVGLGGAHGPEILKHVAQFSTTSVNSVTFFEPACVITGCLPT